MRGLACVLMFQTHCYDSWLAPAQRQTTFFMWSQLGGTLPAPLFLFLAGISFALVTDKLRQRGLAPQQVAASTIRRGAEIFGLGLLLRLQEFVLAWGWAPWTDLLRVDILNTIGLSMMLMGLVCWMAGCPTSARFWQMWVRGAPHSSSRVPHPSPLLAWVGVFERMGARLRSIAAAAAVAIIIPLLTPPLWTTWRLRWLPWPLQSYICGVHTFDQPQSWLFPIFPWAGFAFAGLAVGFMLFSDSVRRREAAVFAAIGAGGAVLIAVARWFDHSPRQLYAVYDFWHTSPNFFFIRLGLLLLILSVIYGWCRWGLATWSFSPLIQLGQTSLLVYWVHIAFVYGKFSILPKRADSIATATWGLLIITAAMLVLSRLRTEWKARGENLGARLKALGARL